MIHLIVGSAFIAGAIVINRQTLVYAIVTNGVIIDNIIAAVFCAFIVWFLIIISMSLYFYATHFRFIGFLSMTAACILDYQIFYATMTVQYQPGHISDNLSSLYTSTTDATVITLLASVLGAVTGVVLLDYSCKQCK
jgi:hypothetical protein